MHPEGALTAQTKGVISCFFGKDLRASGLDIPFILEDGQIVGRLVYDRLTEIPDQLYGQGIGSHYQAQGLKLSKHFKQD